ncbi:phosphatase PAP2 family protein [Candidatus Parcubacteria bacterium]|nr:MAG: phosphatase PAP2 family protein [Candidatus Parcubacteria bacterium]
MNEHLFWFFFQASHQHAALDFAVKFFASYLPYLFLAGLVYLGKIGYRDWRARWNFFVTLVLSAVIARGVLVEIIRFFYPHPRPFVALGIDPLFISSGNSFPSGHAATFFAFAAVVIMLAPRWGWWLFFFALLNGMGRVAAGVHWPADILGGIGVGIASGLLAVLATKARPLFEEKETPSSA